MRALLKLGLALLAALAAADVALHVQPRLLPRRYLAGFLMGGVEFYQPGIFERTPVEGLPLPLVNGAYRGVPPGDLKEMGLAPHDVDDDARAFPDVELPADELGLPKPAALERADLVLVGDSFGVPLGARRPIGLQQRLVERTGLAVYNVSVAAIGPVQERWLLENVGLPKKPRAVLWFFFSGNDLTASYEPLLPKRDGRLTWEAAWSDRRRPPRLILPDLVRSWFERAPPPKCPAPLPGFRFRLADGGTRPIWFHPDYLRQLGWPEPIWQANPVWGAVQTELRAARDACRAANAQLLFVYTPSKAEVYLPYVERDPALALATITAMHGAQPPGKEEEIYDQLLAHRRVLEGILATFCAQEGIAFFSALPALEAQAARGEFGYLVTDTHWSTVAQDALLEPLLDFLRAQGVLE